MSKLWNLLFLPTLGIIQHFNLLLCVKWYIMVIWSSISLTTSEGEHLTTCILDILVSFYVQCLCASCAVECSYLQTIGLTPVRLSRILSSSLGVLESQIIRFGWSAIANNGSSTSRRPLQWTYHFLTPENTVLLYCSDIDDWTANSSLCIQARYLKGGWKFGISLLFWTCRILNVGIFQILEEY